MKMLFDVFICHASEDKRSFVRPLAEALSKENVEVWYDDFTLKLGDSIRRALDRGLKQSRFGIIVLSRAFFGKKWPQYELDALAEREMQGSDKILLPVWHGVTHDDIMEYSPALADRKAVSSADGIQRVVDEILNTVHPQQSPLIVARDMLLEWGVTPPVITDEYWLTVVEAANRIPGYSVNVPEDSAWYRWSFPLPEKGREPQKWGERLGWAAMQMNWVKTAEKVPISPLTPADQVLKFISSHPGLQEICMLFPSLLAEYAPQLTIRGFGGPFEEIFEKEYRKSCTRLTRNKADHTCDEEWILRHPTYGNFEPDEIAFRYFHSGLFGPHVSPYEDADHVFWLLSSASSWLPKEIHTLLLNGAKSGIVWPWFSIPEVVPKNRWKTCGELARAIQTPMYKRGKFRWTSKAKDDALKRISVSAKKLHLTETPQEIFKRFVASRFPEYHIQAYRRKRRKKRDSFRSQQKKPKRQANNGIGK